MHVTIDMLMLSITKSPLARVLYFFALIPSCILPVFALENDGVECFPIIYILLINYGGSWTTRALVLARVFVTKLVLLDPTNETMRPFLYSL